VLSAVFVQNIINYPSVVSSFDNRARVIWNDERKHNLATIFASQNSIANQPPEAGNGNFQFLLSKWKVRQIGRRLQHRFEPVKVADDMTAVENSDVNHSLLWLGLIHSID